MANAIPLPAEAVEQAATSAVSRGKSALAIMGWIDGLFVLAAFAAMDKRHDVAGLIAGVLFWICILTLVTMRMWRRVKTARNALVVAKTSTTTTWLLDNRTIIAINERNIPQLDLTFKITSALRDTLLAVPEARVVKR